MTQKLPHISLYIRDKPNAKGLHQIQLRIHHNGKSQRFKTGIEVPKNSFKNGKVSGLPNSDWINATLNKLLNEKQEEILKQYTLTGEVNFEKTEKQNISFIDYATEYYKSKNNKATKGYINRCISDINKLKTYCNNKNISFERITAKLLSDFEQWIYNTGIKRNTANRIFKKIREPYNKAFKTGIYKGTNVFAIYQPPTYKQPNRTYLTIDEIKTIEDLKDLAPELELVKNFFLLSCYTGLRYSDINNIKIVENNNIKRIILKTTKTGEPISIAVTGKILELINKIDGRLIPTNQYCNRMLKLITELAGINKTVSFHIGRHSFAVNSASLGIPIEAVSRLLGHNNIKTTAIYFKITNPVLDGWMQKWNQV